MLPWAARSLTSMGERQSMEILPDASEARVSTSCPPTPPPEPSTRDAAHEWRATRRSRDGNRPSVTLTKPTTPAPVGPLSTGLTLLRRPLSRLITLPPQSNLQRSLKTIRVAAVAQVIPAQVIPAPAAAAGVRRWRRFAHRERELWPRTSAGVRAVIGRLFGAPQASVSPQVLAQRPDFKH